MCSEVWFPPTLVVDVCRPLVTAGCREVEMGFPAAARGPMVPEPVESSMGGASLEASFESIERPEDAKFGEPIGVDSVARGPSVALSTAAESLAS